MPWFRTDDGLPEHPKSDALEAAAGGWQVYAVACMAWRDLGCDCSRRLTDGAFTRQRAHRVLRAPPKIIDRALDALVTAGFFDSAGPDAFQFHDWSVYNPTRAKVEAEREAKTKRQQRWRGGASQDDVGDDSVDASTEPSRDASTSRLSRARSPSRPVPSPEEEKSEPVADSLRDRPTDGGQGKPAGLSADELAELTALRAEKAAALEAARLAAEAAARELAEKEAARRSKNRAKAKAREENPPPFSVGEAFELIASTAGGRFAPGVERDWTRGIRIATATLIRTYPTREEWQRLGRWLAAGGDAFRKVLGPSWVASTACSDAMARSREWSAAGEGPVGDPMRSGVIDVGPRRPAAPVEPEEDWVAIEERKARLRNPNPAAALAAIAGARS